MLVLVTTAFITEADQEPGSDAARSLIELDQSVCSGPRARAHAVATEIAARFVQLDGLNGESVAATAVNRDNTAGSVSASSAMGSSDAEPRPSRGDFKVIGVVDTSSTASLTMATTPYSSAQTHIRINAPGPGCSAIDLTGKPARELSPRATSPFSLSADGSRHRSGRFGARP